MDFSDMNLLPFVIFILSLWLLVLITFILSFSKRNYVSTVSYVIFVLISIYWGYITAGGIRKLGSYITYYSMLTPEGIFKEVIPFTFCILSFVSGVLWFFHKRKIARWLGLISFIAVILVYIRN
ncbi:hypothetical protein ACHOLT_18310 [Desulfitobacterium sp. Sab5]|uniref:hypothetical protein n=1 Tax=Desulfitobacterium nosdiversum TaxID=3375356 RepID=UPI003CF40426